MNNPGQILNAKNAFLAILLFVAAALAFMAPNAAVNVDEQLHYPHAKKVVNWYYTGGEDQSCLHTPVTNLKYYGQSVDNFTALFNRIFRIEDEFLVRHLTGAFFFLLLLLFTGLIAHRLSGSWLVAVFSVLALLFMPRLAGQAFGNLKDIPFAAGYMAGIFLIIQFVKEMPRPRWETAILLGLAIAFTISVRAGGFILFAYLGLCLFLFFVLKPFYLKQIVSTKPVFVRLLGQGAVILVIGYFAGLLFWPFALQNIIAHPFESLQVMEHYKVSIRQVFEGEMMWSTQLPWYYLPKWMLISTPLFTLIGFLLFLWFFIKDYFLKKILSQQFYIACFVFFSFAFPLIYVIAIGSNLYSGVRQMLFIFPSMALLAVWGTFRLIQTFQHKQKVLTIGLSVFFFAILVWPLKHQATTFPVDYVYFNPFAGGYQSAWGNYEYDYYFHGLKEPAEHLIELAGGEEVTIAVNCNLSHYFEKYPNIKYQYTRFLERSSVDWDYGLFGLNYIHPHLLKNNLWQPEGIIKTFYHRGNPLAILVKKTDKSDFYGISEIKSGNLKQGTELLEQAVANDRHNVWLFVNLAKAKLEESDVSGFEYYLKKGKEIHPYYEPLFLLNATRFFEEGKYDKSLQELEALIEINPRYLPAKKLFENVKRQMD